MRAIDIYLSHFNGNQSAAARALGVKQGHIWHWMHKSKSGDMPIERIPAAAKIIGKRPYDLKPSFFE
jgi:Putative antitoxin of bacterial toxin-antitoxin system, YdaS/YdaT